MRNEIFERINQNRLRYLSELNSSISEKKEIKQENEGTFIAGENNSRFVLDDIYSKLSHTISKLQIVDIPGKQFISRFTSKFLIFKLLWSNISKINNKLNYRKDRLTEGFYNFSSQIFEDKYVEHKSTDTNMAGMSLNLITTGSNACNITLQTQNGLAETYSILASIDRIKEKLSFILVRMIRYLILWFEEDLDIGESLNSLSVEQPPPNDKIIEIRSSSPRYLRTIYYHFETTLINLINEGSKRISRILSYLPSVINPVNDKKSIKFFPSINKFI